MFNFCALFDFLSTHKLLQIIDESLAMMHSLGNQLANLLAKAGASISFAEVPSNPLYGVIKKLRLDRFSA